MPMCATCQSVYATCQSACSLHSVNVRLCISTQKCIHASVCHTFTHTYTPINLRTPHSLPNTPTRTHTQTHTHTHTHCKRVGLIEKRRKVFADVLRQHLPEGAKADGPGSGSLMLGHEMTHVRCEGECGKITNTHTSTHVRVHTCM